MFFLQFLPRLCQQLTGAKGAASSTQAPPSGPLISGHTSTLGSRASLRQGGVNTSSAYQARTPGAGNSTTNPFLQTGTSHHQSLPRHPIHSLNKTAISTTTITTTTHTPITTTHAGNVTLLNTNGNDEDASYKSFSRDSGHGGSEQEDSPRTHWTNTHHHHSQQPHQQTRYTNSLTADLKQSYLAKLNRLNLNGADDNSNRVSIEKGNNIHVATSSAFPHIDGNNQQMVTVPNSYTTALYPNLAASVKATNYRGPSPWNHTYMEIEHEVDPVYEEVERERWEKLNGNSAEFVQVSDISDEEVKRTTPSDMSRQSSRSYGDSRPLLPYYSQQQQQQLRQQQQLQYQQEQFALNEERIKDFNTAQIARDHEQLQRALSQQQDLQQQQQQQQIQLQQQQQQQHLSRENLMTVAVLNGEQVVCRLSSPAHHQQQQNPQQPASSSSSLLNSPSSQYQPLPQSIGAISASNIPMAASPASNGCPAHLVISRPPHLVPQKNQQQLFNEC